MEKTADKIYKNRWLILFNVVMMTFMSTLDSSIVNVALPVMSKSLKVNMASIEWVVTSYLILISSTILFFGRLGDIKGKTNVFTFGIVLFTVGSLLCGISSSLQMLVIARCAQAVGAAAAMANNQGIIAQVFPPNERGRALGITGTFVALGTMIGPPLGGFVISVVSWKYIFLINLPIGLFTFIMCIKILPRSRKAIEEKLDLKGGFLFFISIVLLFTSLILGRDYGYENPMIFSGFIASIIAMILFVVVEKKTEMPLLQLNMFKNKLFSLSIFCGFTSFIAIAASNIIQPFYLQDVMKFSPAVTGILMMVYPIVLSVVAPISGYLSDKIGSEFLTFLGLLLSSIGLFLMATLNENTEMWILVCFVGVMSLGNGLFQSPNNSLIMSTVPKDKLGIAGSVNALVRNLGMVVGISLGTSLLYNRMSHKIGYSVFNYVQGREDVFVYGMRYVYITVGVICVLGAVLTAIRLYNKKHVM